MTSGDSRHTDFTKDLQLWLFAVLYLGAFRLLLTVLFSARLGPETGLADLLQTAWVGARFDARVSAYVILPSVLLGLLNMGFGWRLPASAVRRGMAIGYLCLITLLCAIDIGYVGEFDDQFNHHLLGLYYDDRLALWQTIRQAYPLVVLLPLLGLALAASVWVARRVVDSDLLAASRLARAPESGRGRAMAALLVVAAMVVAARGSIGERPVQRKDAAVTGDQFLNKLVLNPIEAIRYALKDHRIALRSQGLERFLADGDVTTAAQRFFGTDQPLADLRAYTRRVAAGAEVGRRPRHLFVVIMESQDAWLLLPQYASLGLSPRLAEFGRRGVHVPAFLPATPGSARSLVSVLTGIPDAGVFAHYQPSGAKPYFTSIAPIFSRLGYRTRFFAGVNLSWQRMGQFASAQGFDEVYGGGDVGEGYSGSPYGVDDEYLFDFVLDQVSDDAPSFNLIVTGSNHSPYTIDVFGKGFPLREIPPEIGGMFEADDLVKLGHYWYADHVVGGFVDRAQEKLERPAFAFTGDHYSRRFAEKLPDVYAKTAVAFVLYGDGVVPARGTLDDVAGDHLDISTTLIELSAPAGFEYHSLGEDLLAAKPASVGIGLGVVIGPDYLVDTEAELAVHPVAGSASSAENVEAGRLKRMHDDAHALGWWLVMRGPGLTTSGDL